MTKFLWIYTLFLMVPIAAFIVAAFVTGIAHWDDPNTQGWVFILVLLIVIALVVKWLDKK